MKTKYRNLIGTERIDIKCFLPTAEHLIRTCDKYHVKNIMVFFGDPSWGYSYYTSQGYEIKERIIPVDTLLEEINRAQNSTKWSSELGFDDLTIKVQSYHIEIYYNHHSQIYISYDESNNFLDDILNYYKDNSLKFNHL